MDNGGATSGYDGVHGLQHNRKRNRMVSGYRWAYALESTFARGTSTYVPFFDANGQMTEGIATGQGLRYYNAGGNLHILEAKSAIEAKGVTGINSGNGDLVVSSATSAGGRWSFSVLESSGAFSFYDAISAQTPVTIAKNSGNARININSVTTALSGASLLTGTVGSTVQTIGNATDAIGGTGTWRVLNGSNIFSITPTGTSPYFAFTNGTQRGYFQATVLDGVRMGSITNHPIVFVTNSTTKAYITGTGRFGIAKAAPDYILDATSTDAYGLPRGTVAQRPTIVASTTPIRYNTDSTALEYGESVGTWRQLATRAYARTLDTWLGTRLAVGSVTINAASNADLFINNLDSVKFGKTLIRSSNNGLLILNPDVGATGISTFGVGYHTVLNGTIGGSNGGTGHIVVGGTATANSSGAIFNVSIGYTSNTNGAYASAFGYNADATADNTLAIGRDAVSDEAGEISIGSSNYTKLNLNAGGTSGQIVATNYGAGNKEATDLSKTVSAYASVYATDGTLLEYLLADLGGSSIYTGSGTLSSDNTRALIGEDNKLSFSQVYNSGADSARITITNSNSTDGFRAIELEVLDTVHAGGKANLKLVKDSDNDIMSIRGEVEDQDGATTFSATGSGFSVTATNGIGLLSDVASEVQITGLVKAKQEAYNEITSTSSPQTLSSTYSDNLINQGGTQATFTLNMPASPEDGQVCTITYNNAISTLTIDGNGETIVGSAVVTAVPGSQRKFKFYSGIGWIKIYASLFLLRLGLGNSRLAR
jgi:hypothetical protein